MNNALQGLINIKSVEYMPEKKHKKKYILYVSMCTPRMPASLGRSKAKHGSSLNVLLFLFSPEWTQWNSISHRIARIQSCSYTKLASKNWNAQNIQTELDIGMIWTNCSYSKAIKKPRFCVRNGLYVNGKKDLVATIVYILRLKKWLQQ